MGYYCAWGDAKMCSSEEEGYEYRTSDSREKRRNRLTDTFGEISSGAVLPISDDADRQFWAEDELSNSESRQKLTARKKRRHSVSYRNRTVNRSRSCAPNASNSSSDSICTREPEVCKMRKCCRRQKPKTKKLQSINTEKDSSTSIEKRICTMNEVFSPDCQTASTSNKKSTNLHCEYHRMNSSYRNHRKRANEMIRKKIGLQKMRGPSNNNNK
ncbi:uncharacterized protein LOC126850584 [Cataglyphis hispanica]|uniref:uncharacterized protein LOC126850584 n=1 Tax=Cataglyphis hispanica TaxID=1086592 RepID=UPI002180805E|nr:uncharacterized protein LOC126850584 [Cataglyphis hispanica]